MIAWIDAAGAADPPRVFGLTIVERHLQALVRMPARPTRVVVELGVGGSEIPLPPALVAALPIEQRRTPGDFVARLRALLTDADRRETVLLLDGGVLVDARVHACLAARATDTVALAAQDAEPAAAMVLMPGSSVDDLLVGGPADLHALACAAVARGRAVRLREDELDGFIRKLRRSLPFYLFAVDGPRKVAKIAEVERFLFWSNYKGSTDLFTRYVYPPLVWLLVRPLARWRVHPNVVTLVSIVLALAAIPCWASGHFVAGFIMAYAMSVLDSVDGKLARLTFTDSKIGNLLDHGLDMVHPPLWYVAWAYGLGDPNDGWGFDLAQEAVLVSTFYVLDRAILKIYPRFFQRAFHTHSRMDGLVRSVIARRNITLPIFMVGYFAGYGEAAFRLIAFWQIVTTLYHAGRTFWILVVQRAHRPADVSGTIVGVE